MRNRGDRGDSRVRQVNREAAAARGAAGLHVTPAQLSHVISTHVETTARIARARIIYSELITEAPHHESTLVLTAAEPATKRKEKKELK